jgi:quinol monooxygenase YgiN
VSVVVVATIVPKEGKMDEVEAAFAEAIPAVHGEDGCELYALHRKDDRLVMVEKWSSQEALGVHSQGETLKALGAKLRELVQSRMDVQVLTPVPAGDAAKGAL